MLWWPGRLPKGMVGPEPALQQLGDGELSPELRLKLRVTKEGAPRSSSSERPRPVSRGPRLSGRCTQLGAVSNTTLTVPLA